MTGGLLSGSVRSPDVQLAAGQWLVTGDGLFFFCLVGVGVAVCSVVPVRNVLRTLVGTQSTSYELTNVSY